jgi:hypothetical protein
MTHFKQALLDDLVARVDTTPAPVAAHRVGRRRVILAGTAVAAAATAVAGYAIAGGTPAYAVDKHADGSVTITFRELANPRSATADLRKAGLRAQVVVPGKPGSCPQHAGSKWSPTERPAPFPAPKANEVLIFMNNDISDRNDFFSDDFGPGNRLTLFPGKVPAGASVFIVEYPSSKGGLVVGFGLVNNPAPTCWQP